MLATLAPGMRHDGTIGNPLHDLLGVSSFSEHYRRSDPGRQGWPGHPAQDCLSSSAAMPRDWGTVKRKPPQVVKVDPAIPSKIVYPPRLRCRGTEGPLKESHHRSSRSTRPSRPRSSVLLGCGAEGPLKESHHRSSRLTQPSRPRSSVLLGCGAEGPLKESHHIC